MILSRIDSEKNLGKKVERIEIINNGDKIVITKDIATKGLRIHKDSVTGSIMIMPCVGNEIIIS